MTSPRVLLAGLSVVALWASAFPAIGVATPDLGVIGLSFVRLSVAASVLLGAAPFLRVRRPAARDRALVVACAFFGMTAYQLLLNTGELSVPAGTSSIVAGAPSSPAALPPWRSGRNSASSGLSAVALP